MSKAVTRSDLGLRPWELATLIFSGLVVLAMSYLLISDFSIRRILWPSTGEGQLAQPIGQVTYVLNGSLRQGRGDSEFSKLKKGDPVYPFDTLIAGPESALKITLNDKTLIQLGENSMVKLNFDSLLQLSGLSRETVVEVLTGTVAAQGKEDSTVRVKSQGKLVSGAIEKGIEVSHRGGQVATREGMPVDLVESVKEAVKAKLDAAAANYKKMGGVMTANRPVNPALNTLPPGIDHVGGVEPVAKGKVARPLGGGAAETVLVEKTQKDVAMNTKTAEDMMKSAAPKLIESISRAGLAKATEISPDDNLEIQAVKGQSKIAFPINFAWKSDPEKAAFKLRLVHDGDPEGTKDVVLPAQAVDGDVSLSYSLTRPGDYTWKIEDSMGTVLSVRRLHVNSRFKAIELYDPVLVGRDLKSAMWEAQDKWGFLFKWRPIPGIKSYQIKITRNIQGTDGAVATRTVSEPEFILPYKKTWSAEHMFFNVEGRDARGSRMLSRTVSFMFTFLPPKPRNPPNKRTISRMSLVEGQLTFEWLANSEASKFTLEISKDPLFRNKLDVEQTSDTEYIWYPDDPGKYYWHIRGESDELQSPFSETWQFVIE